METALEIKNGNHLWKVPLHNIGCEDIIFSYYLF
jgi:hypothetical protein